MAGDPAGKNDLTLFSVDGVGIHVEGTGPETIVMVHGWPDTHRLWDAQVAALKDRYRCVRFTLPGFDRAHERRARTLDQLSDFLRRVCEQAAPGQKVTLLLHDWGCPIGYQFYLRHPALVARIIGVDIGDPRSLRAVLTLRVALMILAYQLWLAIAWRLGGRMGDHMTRFMAARLRHPAGPEHVHSGMTYPYFMTWFGGADGWRRHMRPFFPEVPMLYVYARRKPFMFHAPHWVAKLAAVPGNAVVEFDTNHWVMQQDSARFNQVVGEWLAATKAA
jgi:cis-3-alkyl-4-acyloxetan-2-one decarboxylase